MSSNELLMTSGLLSYTSPQPAAAAISLEVELQHGLSLPNVK